MPMRFGKEIQEMLRRGYGELISACGSCFPSLAAGHAIC